MYCQMYWNDKNKEKETGNVRFLQTSPKYLYNKIHVTLQNTLSLVYEQNNLV